MTSTIYSVLAYALIPAGTVIAGGALAALRPPGPKVRSAVQHLAAGLVFAAVAVEILPDMMHERKPVAATIGFSIGVALMLLVKQLTAGLEQEATGDEPKVENRTGLLITLGVDVLIDGLLIGVSFAAGAKAGVVLTVALAVEVMFLGLAAAVAYSESGASRSKMIGVCAGLAVLLLAGAALGAIFLHNLTGALLEGVLAFGCAALLYLVIEELMVEAHEEKETPVQTAMFFVGFIALLITEMIA
ncbi:MAG: transporter [Acidobacteria bacterium]|nr:transporter [Acidobacteriota bacterium]